MTLLQRIDAIHQSIASAAKRSNRPVSDIHLVAVSKMQPIALIEQAYAAGLRDFGENYVQELVEKREKLRHLKDIRWHFIGHLQTNKCKLAVVNADYVHAVDSLKLAQALDRSALALQKTVPVFVQVNLDGEISKGGVSPGDLDPLVDAILKLPALRFAGLMCIPQAHDQVELMRPAFRRLAAFSRDLASAHDLKDRLQLSMGMSEDFEVAIEEGATWVRVGRKLFGDRPTP